MRLVWSLLSKRFMADGQDAVTIGREERRALSAFLRDVSTGEIVLSSHRVCPLCGGNSGTVIGEKDRLGVPCRTVVCQNCGLVFNDSFLDTESAVVFYGKYWRRMQWGGDPERNFELRTRPNAYAWKRFAYVALKLEKEFSKMQVVAEAGCGDGCNLLPYYLLGKEVVGCDYDEACLSLGRRKGMQLIKGGTEELLNNDVRADLVIFSYVMEHFIHVDSELKKIRKMMRQGGYVYVEVPGIRNMNRRRCEFLSEDGFRSTNDFLGYLQFQHNYHFELSTLRPFLERNGFECVTGDEWIRAIFRYVPTKSLNRESWHYRSNSSIIKHLQTVEKDYLSTKNRLLLRGKAGLAWLGNHMSL